jgi:hypothetical protein
MELYILNPFRDLDNKPPTIDPLQDWAFGVVLLNILYGAINFLPENHLQQLLTPALLVPISFSLPSQLSVRLWQVVS